MAADSMFETLESRRLMSVVVDVRRPGGGKEVTVSTVGQKVNLEVWATVTGTNNSNTDEGLQIAVGSLLSTDISGGAARGKISVSLVTPFDALGSSKGFPQDLDNDGDLDVGSNDNANAPGFIFARSSGMTTDGTDVTKGQAFHLANITFTVGTLLTGARTDIVFRPRNHTTAFLAKEDGQGVAASNGGVFVAGSGVALTRPANGVITGRIFNDKNGDGIQNGTDAKGTGFSVFLDADFDGVKDLTESQTAVNSNGDYSFNGVKTGVYRITPVPRSGWRVTAPARGYHQVTLGFGETKKGFVFGETQSVRISGRVWRDTDGDKVFDASESALVGVTVFLDRNKNGILDTGDNTAKSDSKGNFTFFGIGANSYQLRVVKPTGFNVTAPTGGFHSFTIGAGQVVTGKNFGLRPIA